MLKPFPSSTFESSSHFSLPANSVLFHGFLEERSLISTSWFKDSSVTCLEIQETNDISCFYLKNDLSKPIRGNNLSELRAILSSVVGREIYIDLTGLSHHVWMPLLKCGIQEQFEINCIYVEPEKYKPTNTPRPGEFYDLSESIRGIYPLLSGYRRNSPL